MFPRSWLLVVVLVLLLSSLVSPWRRRRRRRAPPPPPVNCQVSSWSSWSACSKKCEIGLRTRTRHITIHPAYGGASCPTALVGVDGCGQVKGGCGDTCIESDGRCVCTSNPGYELQGNKKSCADKNECLDGSAACINSNCRNTDGSYVCDCLPGYQPSSNRLQCVPKSCTPLTAPQCPADAYRDEFGTTCTPATINCPNGYQYQDSCTLTCTDSYKLAVIAQPNFRQKFAENFTTVDFDSPSDRTVCTVDPNSGSVSWDWNPGTTPYYCRRVNDPPLGVTISKTVINEKESVLTPVGKLSATDPQKDHLTFSISNPKGNLHFLIQGNMLLVKTPLVWTPNLGDNTYSVVVNVSDNGSPMMHSAATLNITVLNINDPPYGLELSNNEISENVPVNYTVGNLTAIDDDVSPQRTSNFSWEIVDSDDGFFSLRGSEILVAKSLDHESKNIHRIQVRCTDYGNPRKSSQVVSMSISVRDSNDSPKHINLTNHRVSENSPVGTLVGKIIARDDDNDTLSFDLNGTDSRVLRKFALQGSQANCGLRLQDGKSMQTCSVPLVVNGSLDYEVENEYIIWVGVTDPGGVTHKRFRIEVENVNEESTDILISDDRVPENSPGGTVVGEFLVKDPDNKNRVTQSHTCSLLNSLNGDEDAFYISQINQRNLLRVKANAFLDFETKTIYNITVSCSDTDLAISKSFLIEITDVNERPTSLVLSSTSVNESDSNMTHIGTLSAEDPEGINQTFIYTVRDSQSFRIGGTNKDQLFFLGPLDYEHTQSISVRLRVTDNGGLHLEKIFTITVQDLNDPPTDIRLQADAKLPENSGENVFISQVEMIDQDSNTRASCRLLNSSNDRVSLSSNALVVGPTITDYESLGSSKSLQILVRCEDQYGASVTRWINLPVEDVNEAPTDLTLSKLEIRENRNDTLVGILEITDPDVGQRHNCTILDVDTPFYIDSSTNPPTLKTVRPLDFESSRVEYVDIKCEDIVLDQAGHSTEKQFKINVIDVNEAPQILCNTPFHALPSFSRGSVLGQIQNYDPDNERYHMSKKQNPNGPFEIRKQLLNYRFENENISWPFDITQNGIIYLEKRLTAEEYNGSIIFGIRVDDDGAVWERSNGSEEYRIKTDETKYSVQNCAVLIASNETQHDIHLSSNTISENSTYGTIIGNLSRRRLLEHEQISYHILEEENGTQPFEIDQNILKLKLGNTLDYEVLPAEKTFPITISSVASISGVFTKQFLIEILDVNEMPTAICLTSPRPLDDCSVVGHILIEDLDYLELQCGSSETIDLEKFSSQLSEYTCHIQEGVDTLSNKVIVDEHFYIQDSPPSLYVNKTIFTHGDTSYDVPILCRSTKQPLHILSTTLNVNIKVPDDENCRRDDLCASCPQPSYCLTHVKAAGECVDEDYRINSTVAIPVSIFEKPGFISMFENYVTSLIEGTAQGKTLAQLVQDFNNQNDASRRRREAEYSDVYVEQLVYVGQGTSTNVVFAVAEKPSYNLIPASAACELLKNTEVKCLADDTNTSGSEGGGAGESGFPLWIIYIVAGVIVVAFIILLIVIRRRRAKKSDNIATAHFASDGNTVALDSMYETPVDDVRDQSSLSHSGTSNPVLVEKRKDIKVFHNPTYRSQASVKDSDSETEETEESKRRTMNQYETTDPVPVYETIDDDLYEKVHDEKMKEHEAAETAKKRTPRKSRTNPVYDIGEDDDSLNPVVNLAVTSPSRKTIKDGDDVFFSEENESDDSLTTEILSTFQPQTKARHSYENVGVVNPLASHSDDVGEGDSRNGPYPLYHQDSGANSGDGQTAKGDSKPPIKIKNELYPLEHQSSFEVNDDQVPQSPPPVYDNNELYSLEQQMKPEDGNHSSC